MVCNEVSSLPEEILAVAALGRAYCDSQLLSKFELGIPTQNHSEHPRPARELEVGIAWASQATRGPEAAVVEIFFALNCRPCSQQAQREATQRLSLSSPPRALLKSILRWLFEVYRRCFIT